LKSAAVNKPQQLYHNHGGRRMNISKLAGIGLLVLGAILLYFGINATESPVEEIGEAITGKYSDDTMMYLIGGAIAAVAGLFLVLKKG
jgi:drug/metabolite transporter (DMT)-like permease